MTGFEPATTRPPDAYSNRAELHPAHVCGAKVHNFWQKTTITVNLFNTNREKRILFSLFYLFNITLFTQDVLYVVHGHREEDPRAVSLSLYSNQAADALLHVHMLQEPELSMPGCLSSC